MTDTRRPRLEDLTAWLAHLVRRWRRRVVVAAISIAALAGVSVLAATLVLGYDAPCVPETAGPGGGLSMKALRYHCYGSADVLTLEEVEKPRPAADAILVRVRAASVNPLDWHYMHGTPYIMRLGSGIGRPTDSGVGVDFAGVVEAVGDAVTEFAPGDAVFGARSGAIAEYVTIRAAGTVVAAPAALPLDELAAVPVAAVTALQAVRDKAQVRPGQRVLVNGASGGVGTFAVQIAKAFGAHVTGVSSTRNLELVRSLGADHVVDYTREDFAAGSQRYDAVIDAVGNRSLAEIRRVLTPNGVCVLVGGGGPEASLLGPIAGMARGLVYAQFVSQAFVPFMAEVTRDNLSALRDLLQQGSVRPVIDRRYPLAQSAEAIRYLETGRARGKVIVTMPPATVPTSRPR